MRTGKKVKINGLKYQYNNFNKKIHISDEEEIRNSMMEIGVWKYCSNKTYSHIKFVCDHITVIS